MIRNTIIYGIKIMFSPINHLNCFVGNYSSLKLETRAKTKYEGSGYFRDESTRT